MEIREELIETLVILEPVGQLDTRTSPELEGHVNRHLGEKRQSFIVDFQSLDYISSAGLRVLLMLAKRLKSSDGKLVLAGMNAHVREVFDVAGFTKIFEIVSTRDEARGRLSSVEVEEERIDPQVDRIAQLASRLMSGDAFRPAKTDEVPLEVLQVADKAAELLGIASHRRKQKPAKAAPPPPPPPPAPAAAAAQPSEYPDEETEEKWWQKILRMLGIDRW